MTPEMKTSEPFASLQQAEQGFDLPVRDVEARLGDSARDTGERETVCRRGAPLRRDQRAVDGYIDVKSQAPRGPSSQAPGASGAVVSEGEKSTRSRIAAGIGRLPRMVPSCCSSAIGPCSRRNRMMVSTSASLMLGSSSNSAELAILTRILFVMGDLPLDAKCTRTRQRHGLTYRRMAAPGSPPRLMAGAFSERSAERFVSV